MFANAKNPRWTDKDHTRILLDVLFIGEEAYEKFCAAPDDCTTHGPMLYNFAVNGLFGAVGDSDEERILRGELPVPEGYAIRDGGLVHAAHYVQEAEAELSRRLAGYTGEESKARAEVDPGYAAERKVKIQALLAVRNQPGWPFEVEWPE